MAAMHVPRVDHFPSLLQFGNMVCLQLTYLQVQRSTPLESYGEEWEIRFHHSVSLHLPHRAGSALHNQHTGRLQPISRHYLTVSNYDTTVCIIVCMHDF